jgi:hypothetical protein
MNPRHLIVGICFAALVSAPRAAAQPAIPALPGTAPAETKPVPAAEEKKSEAKKSDMAPSPDTTPAPAPAHAPEKTSAAQAATKAKLKEIFTSSSTVKAPVAPQPLSPRFLQVRDRIERLFGPRNNPPPPPDARLNPFRPPGAIPVAPLAIKDGVVEPVAVNNNLTLLQQAIATIRVKGTVTRNKVLQLVINTGPGKEGTYKEGDILNINLSPDPVHLKVRLITRNSVTFTLADAEMVLKF